MHSPKKGKFRRRMGGSSPKKKPTRKRMAPSIVFMTRHVGGYTYRVFNVLD